MKELKTLLFNVEQDTFRQITVEDSLEAFYKALGVDIIELPLRSIGGREYTVMCDEEGLLKYRPIPSAMNKDRSDILVGNLMFFNTNYEEGELESLSDDDIEHILDHLALVMDARHQNGVHRVVRLD